MGVLLRRSRRPMADGKERRLAHSLLSVKLQSSNFAGSSRIPRGKKWITTTLAHICV